MTEDERYLLNVAHEFEEGFRTHDLDRITRFYADTYVDVNLRSPVQTKAERREYYARVMARPGLRLSVQPDEVMVRGDLAFVRGTIRISQDAAAETELRFLEVYERGPDGSWQVIWGMDGPVQEYTP